MQRIFTRQDNLAVERLRDTRMFRLLRARLADKYYPLCVQPLYGGVLALLAGHWDQRAPQAALSCSCPSCADGAGRGLWCWEVFYQEHWLTLAYRWWHPGQSVFSKRRNVPCSFKRWGRGPLKSVSCFFFLSFGIRFKLRLDDSLRQCLTKTDTLRRPEVWTVRLRTNCSPNLGLSSVRRKVAGKIPIFLAHYGQVTPWQCVWAFWLAGWLAIPGQGSSHLVGPHRN